MCFGVIAGENVRVAWKKSRNLECVKGLALEEETVVKSTILRFQASKPRAVIPEGAFCGYTTTRLLGIFSATGAPTKSTNEPKSCAPGPAPKDRRETDGILNLLTWHSATSG
jgi:hypothetical protein